MAGNRGYDNSKNPFGPIDDDMDVDDASFLRHSSSGNSGYMFGSSSPNDLSREQRDFEDKRLQLLERKKEIEGRTLESSQRSISLLRDSEQIGVATAEELLRQREQLENTEKRLDEINNTLRFSQKHIQSIKSVFGSLKNYISGRGQTGEPSQARPQEISRQSSNLSSHLDGLSPSDSMEHPAMRLRGLSEEEEWGGGGGAQNSTVMGDGTRMAPGPSAAFLEASKVLDNNLDEMCGSLSRLRGLAEGLGGEISVQNEMLDRIHGKVDRADVSIDRQNRDMKRLLKK